MTVPRIIVVGSINTDLVIRGSRLPRPGETVLGGQYFQAAGGKGANQAVAAARLTNDRVALVAAVGDDALGREALAGLKAEHLDLCCIRTIAGQPSGVALILVDEAGENCISVAGGANSCLQADDVDRIPDEWLQKGHVLLASLEVPWAVVRRSLRRAREAGLTTILNPAPVSSDLIQAETWEDIDLITPNETEARLLTSLDVVDEPTAIGAGRRLQQRGCGACIVTRGAAGCVVVEREATAIPAPQVVAVDTTAAGDAFNGALAVALAEGKTLIDAAGWATQVAAYSVTRAGAQPSLPRRADLATVDR